jgi:hypothetical protein
MNDNCEAYTGNTIGRRGDVPLRGDSAPLEKTEAVGDGFNVPEASTMESYGEISKGLPGSESVACSERSVRNLGDPSASSQEVGYFNRKESVRRAAGSQIIS